MKLLFSRIILLFFILFLLNSCGKALDKREFIEDMKGNIQNPSQTNKVDDSVDFIDPVDLIDPVNQIDTNNPSPTCSCTFRRYFPIERTGNVPNDINYLNPHLCNPSNLEPEQWFSYSGSKAEINCPIAKAVVPYACYGIQAFGDYTDNSECP